jgi:hypothetical protein
MHGFPHCKSILEHFSMRSNVDRRGVPTIETYTGDWHDIETASAPLWMYVFSAMHDQANDTDILGCKLVWVFWTKNIRTAFVWR